MAVVRTTMENWQSEFLQLLAFVTLTSFLFHLVALNPRTATSDSSPADEIRRMIEARGSR